MYVRPKCMFLEYDRLLFNLLWHIIMYNTSVLFCIKLHLASQIAPLFYKYYERNVSHMKKP